MLTAQPTILGPEFAALEDDTEESILGSSAHQGAITTLDDGLNACGRERGLPWYVGNQTRMLIPRRGQRSLTLSPDILVHPTLGDGLREFLSIANDGPPALAIEVLSRSTALERDLKEDAPEAKPMAYAALGIREYIAFDPSGQFVTEQVRAWRLGPAGYELWLPEADGRWHSRALGVSFAVHGRLLRVYDQEGRLVPLGGELRAEREAWWAEQAALRAERERWQAERADSRAERERWQAEQAALRAENARLRALADEAAARERERER